MRDFRTFASLFVLALGACGGSDAKPDAPVIKTIDAAPDAKSIDAALPPDARVYDLSCHGNAAPTTAAATITIAGTAQTLQGMSASPTAGVTVEAHAVTGDVLLGSAGPTTATGTYSIGPIPGNVPVDAYVKAIPTANNADPTRTTLVYPPSPLVANPPSLPTVMIKDTTLNQLLSAAGVTQEAAKGFMIVAVVDCANMPVNGATLSVMQGNTEVGTQFDLGQFAAQLAGTFFVLNVPPGAANVVSASYNGTTFRAHTVKTAAQTTTTTIVRPGY